MTFNDYMYLLNVIICMYELDLLVEASLPCSTENKIHILFLFIL